MPDISTVVDLAPVIAVIGAALTLGYSLYVGRAFFRASKKAVNEVSV